MGANLEKRDSRRSSVAPSPRTDKDRQSPSAEAARAADFKVFQEALREYAADGPVLKRLANAMIEISEEELAEAFRQVPVLDNRLTGHQAVPQMGQALIRALGDTDLRKTDMYKLEVFAPDGVRP